jgi:ubiquinone/menaquinone biosynthesis C-methylase UbiE
LRRTTATARGKIWLATCSAVLGTLASLGIWGLAAHAQGREPPCKYIADIQSVSLPDQAGQPAAIEFTSNTFATYRKNLGLAKDFAEAYAGRRVLDVGAGLSDFVDVMADTYGAEALAVDLAYAELNLEGLRPECVDLFHRRRIAMDASRILFPSNYFDLVVSHSLLRWFLLFQPENGEDPRLRIQRGMTILGQMVRVVNAGGEVRTTDLPDPDGPWYAEHYPELVADYRAAFKEFVRPYLADGDPKLAIAFHDKGGRPYAVIRKLERVPPDDAGGHVRVIRTQRHRPTSDLHR